ncbi:hypothetical protein ACMHYO_15790 [Allopusillimonas ginsengisoli]|uniref:hypothetical protein n=1 Tax=Allopusillimonas ginsengisoli TaxID=453575 RepID=UPI0039C34C5A
MSPPWPGSAPWLNAAQRKAAPTSHHTRTATAPLRHRYGTATAPLPHHHRTTTAPPPHHTRTTPAPPHHPHRYRITPHHANTGWMRRARPDANRLADSYHAFADTGVGVAPASLNAAPTERRTVTSLQPIHTAPI